MKLGRLLLAFGAVGSCAPLGALPVRIDDQITIEDPDQWTFYEAPPNGLIYLDVRQGRETLRALVDTGAPATTVARAYAETHRLSLRTLGDAPSVGGNSHFLQTEIGALDVANAHFAAGPVVVADLSFVADVTGRPIDLIIGAAPLAHMALQIDTDRKRLRFTRSGQADAVASKIPLRTEGANRLMIALEVSGRSLSPIIVDTGSDSGLAIGPGSYKAADLDAAVVTDVASAGAGGVVVSRILRLGALSIGGQRLTDVEATLRPDDDFAVRSGGAGLIGMAILGRYNLVIDPGAGYLGLGPRQTPFVGEAKRTLGLQFVQEPDRLRVVHVMLNSPAWQARMKAGDAVCGINGTQITPAWRSSATGNWGTAPPGTRFEVELCDGRHLLLVTRRFY